MSIVIKDKKRIGYIITKSEVGGAQSWVKDQLEYLKDDADTFLITSEKGWLTEATKDIPSLLDKRLLSRSSITYLFRLVSYIKEKKIQTLVASSANAGIYARLVKPLTGIKCIYVSHGWSSVYNGGQMEWLYTMIERYLSLLTDKIICVSQSDFNTANKKIGIKENKLELIRNGVNPNYRVKERLIFNYESSRKYKILFLGRLAHPKRPDLLAKAVSDLENVELHIVGDGSLRSSIEKKQYKNIVLHGEIKNFNDFNSYDIFALISDSEGLPISALEAGASGLPMILSDVGGCPELVDKNGILTKNNTESLKSCVSEILNNFKKYNQEAVKNRVKFQAKPLLYKRLITEL